MIYSTLKTVAAATLVAGSMALSGTTALRADATSTEIDLTYVWTAQPGHAEQLVATYDAVGDALNANEPGLLFYEIAVSETGDQIIIHETFENSDALAFHLTETAAAYFPHLVEFATPGPFIFRGNVPDELKAAAYQMNIGAIFTGAWSGFDREE